MPFDPNYPPTNAPVDSQPLRNQFTSLKTLIDEAVSGSSANTNNVDFFYGGFSDPPSSGECQALADKVNELIQALRR